MAIIIVWVATLLGAIIGGFQFLNAMLLATSAPQQAAGAAMALCWVVIPYVFSRAIEGMVNARWRIDMLEALGRLATDANLKEGFSSMWKQMDAARTGNTAASSAKPADDMIPVYKTFAEVPPMKLPAEAGKCPDCGVRRYQDQQVCPKCQSTKPVVFA